MGRQYSFLDGELRLYDGTGTKFYYTVKFVQADPQIPDGRPRPEQRLIMDRGRVSSDMKYAKGGDDVVLAPIDITFSARVDEDTNRETLAQALKCGTLGSHNWVSTKGDYQLEGVTLPGFDNDAPMQTVDMEFMVTGDSTNWGRKVTEIFFPPELVQFGPSDSEGLPFSATGRCYGPISSISSFTAGTESTGGTGS